MRTKYFIATLAVSLSLAADLAADVIPGRWELVASLEPGTSIIVKLKTGERMEGSLRGVDKDTLELAETTDRVVRILKAEVKEITGTVLEKDSPLNGALWGLAIGGIGGSLAGAATVGQVMRNEGGSAASVAAMSGLAGAGIGGLIGYVGDLTHKSRPVFYRAARERVKGR